MSLPDRNAPAAVSSCVWRCPDATGPTKRKQRSKLISNLIVRGFPTIKSCKHSQKYKQNSNDQEQKFCFCWVWIILLCKRAKHPWVYFVICMTFKMMSPRSQNRLSCREIQPKAMIISNQLMGCLSLWVMVFFETDLTHDCCNESSHQPGLQWSKATVENIHKLLGSSDRFRRWLSPWNHYNKDRGWNMLYCDTNKINKPTKIQLFDI